MPPGCVFDRDKALDEIEERVLLEDLFPQVGRLVPVRVVGVAGSAITAPIERKEPGTTEGKPRGHVDFVGIDGEVDERPGRVGEKRVLGVAVGAVLLDGVPVGLPGSWVLELGSCDRNAVDEQHEIDGLSLPSS